jgi:Nucleotidyl transferase AbiEii toxin, Type IV TA system
VADDEYAVALRVAAALEELGVEYTLGGSLASSIHGEPRSTNDIDFAVRLEEQHVARFVERLGSDFVLEEDALREAIRFGRSYAMYFLPYVLKIDLFVRGGAPFDRSEFARRVRVPIGLHASVYAATAEDSLLRKLVWFQDGGRVSDRQWRDVLGILRITGSALDRIYLERWADQLGVRDLLKQAFEQT